MKQSTFLILLLLSSSCMTCTPEGLDYIFRSIEYEASIESGTLSLILLDLAPWDAFENVLDAILRSPRLSHVVRYVLNGTDHEGLERLPWNPSMLLINPGKNSRHIKKSELMRYMYRVMILFNPTTKVLAFVDFSTMYEVWHVYQQIFNVGFASIVLYDCNAMRADHWNRIKGFRSLKVPHQMYLFTRMQRNMTGVNITYYAEENELGPWNWNVYWIREAARYLNTEASEYRTYCDELSGTALINCIENRQEELDNCDIKVDPAYVRPDRSREFAGLVTNNPIKLKVGIPRERPLNVAELMVMPFNWNVWLLLVLVLVLAEVVQQFFPNQFKNDPALLVVCGFERHNLHQAGALEKIMLISLIIVMFFMSNAFETKMLSMMVSKPSIQRIKTEEDVLKSDIKFYDDLEARPYFVNQSIFGKNMIQGEINVFDTIPGVGIIVAHTIQDLLMFTAYDYERMQPWYVLLDIDYLDGFEFFQTRWRYENLEILRFIHELLVEAGIMDQWKRMHIEKFRMLSIGKRQRVHVDSKIDLNFEDMQPAWVILAIGWCVSMVTFLGELISNSLKPGLKFKIKKSRNSAKSVQIFDFE